MPPDRLAATLRTLLDTGEQRDNLLITLHRLALGFVIGATGGAAFGILLARSRLFADYLRPTFDLLRQVPTLTLIPLLILLIGVDEPLMPMQALASNGTRALRLPGIARLGGLALWWATPVAFVALWWLASAQR